jgi:hypothetical protein
MEEKEVQKALDAFNKHISQLRRVPIEVRRFLVALASRISRMKNTDAPLLIKWGYQKLSSVTV